MTNPAEIKALVFDVFGTIVDWRSGVARGAAAFLDRHAPSLDPLEFADAWRAEYSPSMEEIRSGRRRYVRLDVLHRENLVRTLDRYGIVDVPDADIDALNLAWHSLDPWPDAVAALQRLKRRFIIAPLSNGNIRLMVDVAKRAGLPWDAILGAEVVRAYKPSPQVYSDTVEILGVEPAEQPGRRTQRRSRGRAPAGAVDRVRAAADRTRARPDDRPESRRRVGFRRQGPERTRGPARVPALKTGFRCAIARRPAARRTPAPTA